VLLANDDRATAAALLSAAAVRERCEIVFAAAVKDEGRHFRLDLERLGAAADRVAAVTRRRYPDLAVPYHSRWRHFAVGGRDRAAVVAVDGDASDQARARIDLAFVSVLLDAGAGQGWHYQEAETGQIWERSEGLAVASLRAMQQGLFSSAADSPWRVDAAALAQITPASLGRAFQHEPGNQLLGLEHRAALLRRLGEVCAGDPDRFGAPARPGHLYDYWRAQEGELSAAQILRVLLAALGPVWPARATLSGVPLGDCGRHSAVPGDGLVPFHKLTQWLAYSLVEPLEAGGVSVGDLDGLTGLAEYRNGGLFIDCGVIVARDTALLRRPLDAMSEPVVEWRAITVALLDRLAPEVRARLGKSAADFPLACVLEGGSWAAGREIAFERRAHGSAPLTIISDGTLF
jgi:Protein of unknown function (DUF1688)